MTHDDAISSPAASQPIGTWLAALGSSAPAPGGGAAAAMMASIAAALVEMVGNLTIGKPAFAEHEPHVTAIRDAARDLRVRALAGIDDDAAAFSELMAVYRLPKNTDQQKAARRHVVQAATLRAAAVPLEIAATAAEVARLAAQLPGRSNPAVLSDVGVAASAAAAAIESAAINVEVNLATLTDPDAKADLAAQLAAHLPYAGQARQLATEISQEIGR
ncbi:MAG TPA: cyclodeaminase/cyclohydrolase family protein [Streptosporangiaceae bacterium]